MKKNLLRSSLRVMLILAFSLIFGLSAATAVFSDSGYSGYPGCTWKITGASVKSTSNVKSYYELTGSGTFPSQVNNSPVPFDITGTATWAPTSPCPDSGTAGTAVEVIKVGGSAVVSTTSHCPKNPWLNDNVQCSVVYKYTDYSVYVPEHFDTITCPLTAALLTSAQKQALKQEEQTPGKYTIIVPKPTILSPTDGQIFLVPSTIPIEVVFDDCPSFGNPYFQFVWRNPADQSWHAENVSSNIQISGNVATANLVLKTGFWRIRACLVAACSDWRGFQIIASQPPSNLKAKANSAHEIALTWEAPSNPGDGYKIERKKTEEQYKEIKTVGLLLGYTDSGLSPGTTYFYRVRTFKIGDFMYVSPYSNEAQAKTPPPAVYIGDQGPKKPSNLTASTVSKTRIKLSWRVSTQEVGSKVDSFMIERKKQGAASFSPLTTVPPNATYAGGPNTYTDTGLLTGKTYFYRVKSHNSTGDSLYSNEASAIPSDLKPSTPPPGTVKQKKVPK